MSILKTTVSHRKGLLHTHKNTVSLTRIGIDLHVHTDIDSLFYLDSTLGYGNGTPRWLDKKSLQDSPARLQVRQGNKITK